MASSNDIEVLDPTATIEKLKNIVSKVALNRRHFMAGLGVAGVAAGTGLLSGPAAEAQQPIPNGYTQVDVLNFLLNLKYLKATFYSFITQGTDLPLGTNTVTLGSGQIYNQPTQVTFTGTNAAQITDMFNEMYYDELNQLIELRAFLGVSVYPRQSINLQPLTAFSSSTSVGPTPITGPQAIALARLLEDISVSAFTNALSYLSGAGLAYATQALAVDGFHSAAIRLASIQTGAPYQSPYLLTATNASVSVGTVANSATLSAVLASIPSPSPYTAGAFITGNGIPLGSTIVSATAKANVTPTGLLTVGSANATLVSSIAGVALGQPVTGTGIAPYTYVVSATGTTIVLSNPATATAVTTSNAFIVAGSNTLTLTASNTALVVGRPITGTGIPAGATITANAGSTTITISQPATQSSQVSFTGSTASGSILVTNLSLSPVQAVAPYTGQSLYVGQSVTGAGILNGTIIAAVGPNTFTLSTPATASASGVTMTSLATLSISCPTPGTLTIGQGSITISKPATVTGTTTAIIATTDPFEVAAVDPGTAALAAAGPSATTFASPVTGVTPALNQGFFATPGTANATTNNPAGLAYARTFSQVLSVLYGNSTLSTFQGGFFPVGVSGNITVV